MALAAYRHLLRSTRIAFQGDLPTLTAARRAARDNFDQNRALASAEETSKIIQHAEDVAKILRENVVQGKAVGSEENRFKLRIHEHIERGDNDTVKMSGKGSLAPGHCCSA